MNAERQLFTTQSMQEVHHKGLSDEQVEQQRRAFGANTGDTAAPSRFLQVLSGVFVEPLFILLFCTALVYFFLGETGDALMMVFALFFVAGISLYQDNKSRRAVDALRALSQPHIRVLRNREWKTVPAEQLVVGDVISLEDGQLIPADARLLTAQDLSLNESILTGESFAVFKKADDAEPFLFKGTWIESGSCVAEVTAVGDATAVGRINLRMRELHEEKTPLQQQVQGFVRLMVIEGAIAFCAVCVLHYIRYADGWQALLAGLTLAMSVLPEEIPVALTTFMALGAWHLYHRRVLARSPQTVETLGAATVICLDKTGTLTENTMEVAMIYDLTTDTTQDLLQGKATDNATLRYAIGASETHPFDRMEQALHALYDSVCGVDERAQWKLIHEYPLSGTFPFMTHVLESDGKRRVAAKGSAEGLFQQAQPVAGSMEKVHEVMQGMMAKGYRVLAVAGIPDFQEPVKASQFDYRFTLFGLIGFYDPPRKNMAEVITGFYNAGVQVRLLTGDHPLTAHALARQVGIRTPEKGLTGAEVTAMDDEQLKVSVRDTVIYSRMFPEAKLRVVKALMANGEVVAMTGDGVNDGPALKAAHIGVAMGKRGSDVARKAAALVLMDDDLGAMTFAIGLGRRIYENLRKAIRYIISIHIPVILIVAVPLFFAWDLVRLFLPVHVIFLELIMGPTCSIVYENEPGESHLMQQAPRKSGRNLFSVPELMVSVVQGLVIAVVCLLPAYFLMCDGVPEKEVRSVVFATLIFSNILLTLSNRSFRHTVFKSINYRNRRVPFVLLFAFGLLLLTLYVEPFREKFQLSPLGIEQLLRCLAWAIPGVWWIELFKGRWNSSTPGTSN